MRHQSADNRRASSLVVLAVLTVAIAVCVAPAVAQTSAKVVAQRSELRAAPRPDAGVVTTVPIGTIVDVLGREGDYYRVLLAADRRNVRLGGYLRVVDVALAGPPAPGAPSAPPVQKAPTPKPLTDKPAAERPPAQKPSAGRPSAQKPTAAARKGRLSPIHVRGFVDVGYESFLAADSFAALFDTSRALFLGGGGEVGFGQNLFVRGSVSRARLEGDRAWVYNDEVFKLGIDETLTLTPIEITAGWALKAYHGLRPYFGGGVGFLQYDEQSALAEASEQVKQTFTSYHVLGGVEYPLGKWLAVAGEFQYTSVPDALGEDGVSKEFGETNLGGTRLHVKVLIGW
jgi:opacity protein-like surface antigen